MTDRNRTRAGRGGEPADLDLDAGLARLGYERFRPGQREAIETLLAAGRLLLVAPTGGGKSLTYQLPATLLPGTTIVISPLIALMQDQAQALEQRGVAVTFLSSTLESGEMRRRMARAAAGDFKLLYVAPERLTYPGFKALLAGPRDSRSWRWTKRTASASGGTTSAPSTCRLATCSPTCARRACSRAPRPPRRSCATRSWPASGSAPTRRRSLQGFARPNLVLRATEISRPARARPSRGRPAARGARPARPGSRRRHRLLDDPRRAPSRRRTRLAASGLADRRVSRGARARGQSPRPGGVQRRAASTSSPPRWPSAWASTARTFAP